MRKKWGSNENIHIGDIFEWFSDPDPFGDGIYYQVTALRGKVQVVLRPLTGDDLREWPICVRGRHILKRAWEEVTAWVINAPGEDIHWLQEVYVSWSRYCQVPPEEWKPWIAEMVRQEESARQNQRQETE